ncbi:MAG: tRNA (adenosine(37)-N6)-dimethylallyltransferase MiaA, partial [Candidatus Binataceae bacterium]
MNLPADISEPCMKPGERPRIGFIVGPTGSGKSALAINIAGRINAEIVNADSRLFYRGLDIGAAKPTNEERRRVAHHLIDIRPPDEPIDAAGFSLLARAAIGDIRGRGKQALVTGGSGLYLRALRHGIFTGPPAATGYRESLRAIALERGSACLHDKLKEIDPVSAAKIGRNDLSRITRALEVFQMTGIPISHHHARHAFADTPYDALTIAISLE